jgi:hypothetical protein
MSTSQTVPLLICLPLGLLKTCSRLLGMLLPACGAFSPVSRFMYIHSSASCVMEDQLAGRGPVTSVPMMCMILSLDKTLQVAGKVPACGTTHALASTRHTH